MFGASTQLFIIPPPKPLLPCPANSQDDALQKYYYTQYSQLHFRISLFLSLIIVIACLEVVKLLLLETIIFSPLHTSRREDKLLNLKDLVSLNNNHLHRPQRKGESYRSIYYTVDHILEVFCDKIIYLYLLESQPFTLSTSRMVLSKVRDNGFHNGQ